jgi:hypothetical protein
MPQCSTITARIALVRRSNEWLPSTILEYPRQPWDVVGEPSAPMDQEEAENECERLNIESLANHGELWAVAIPDRV